MDQIPLPKGYSENIYLDGKNKCEGHSGYFYSNSRHIAICPPTSKWIPKWILKWIEEIIINHERGHAWGIKSCGKLWCIMFESSAWTGIKEEWWENIISFPFQFLNGFKFCKTHREYLTIAQGESR